MWGEESISFRRLEVLVYGLPLESRTARALGAPHPGKWSTVDELLAGLVEIVGDHRNLFVMANRDPKKPKPKLPEVRIPRPGDATRQAKRAEPATGTELRRFLGNRGMIHYTPKTDGENVGAN